MTCRSIFGLWPEIRPLSLSFGFDSLIIINFDNDIFIPQNGPGSRAFGFCVAEFETEKPLFN
jgi:hypothetical protein